MTYRLSLSQIRKMINRKLSIAPMMRHTDRHFRYMFRKITEYTVLYTEMITAMALKHGDRERFLLKSDCENPVVCQVGGDDAELLVAAAKWIKAAGYDAINLNVGCPSERVQSGSFGACLMKEPERVRDLLAEVRDRVDIPVTIKHRIGVDELDSYEHMANFVEIVAQSGVTNFSVHARKAWLKGLSPKENRSVPPIRYDDVYRLKADFPELWIEINGEVKTWDQIEAHLERVDAVMIGRAAVDNPMLFIEADSRLMDEGKRLSRAQIVRSWIPYIESELEKGIKLSAMTCHMMNIFKGEKGGKMWRRELSNAHQFQTSMEPIFRAADAVGLEL